MPLEATWIARNYCLEFLMQASYGNQALKDTIYYVEITSNYFKLVIMSK